ncbi:uncharacterized protein [Rutidosis leptorrhynchoides]|uniref:uncharacterized protein n=1 Tax=Rutidosis leptorrhynchoides TaxID=125765 RepID=UPI003A9906D4
MKNNASIFLKQMVAFLTSIAKAKTIAIKNKTNAAKARLIMFSLVRNKKLYLGSFSNKIHNLLRHDKEKNEDDDDEEEDQNKEIVLYNAMANESTSPQSNFIQMGYYNDDDYDDKYPDLRHCLFDGEELEEYDGDPGGSVIDMVKNSKEEEENFVLEDEIDHVAGLFIKKFHKQIRMQKLLSFKRYQEMLNRGA